MSKKGQGIIVRETKMAMKGPAIVVCDGQYVGLRGWLNLAEEMKVRVPVILTLGDGTFKLTKLDRDSIRLRSKKKSKAAACLDNNPDIDQLMTKMCKKLAKCDLEGEDYNDMHHLFAERFASTAKTQNLKGYKALWRDDGDTVQSLPASASSRALKKSAASRSNHYYG